MAHNYFMAFDWVKAASLIRKRMATSAFAGLAGDWDESSDIIFRDGQPVLDCRPFTVDAELVPKLLIIAPGHVELINCYRVIPATGGVCPHTWPPEALARLSQEVR